MVLGALMLVGGGALSILGLPYLVLERGFTQVIIGSVIATGGVSVLAVGLALRSLRHVLSPATGAASSTGAAVAATGAAGAAVLSLDGADTEPHHPRLPHIDEPAATPPRDEPILTEPLSGAWRDATTETPQADQAAMALKLSPEDRLFSDNYEDLRQSLKETQASDAASARKPEPALGPESAPDPRETQAPAAEEEEPPRDPLPEEPALPAGPTASDEGIVGVRVIGDSTFTMYASGAVRAETPAGVLTFSSIDELKAHLAKAGVG